MSKWGEETTLKFVNMYKEYECLWNFSDNEYRNRQIRDNALEKIVDRMNIESFSLQEAKVKIKNLRSTYSQEVSKINKSKETGQIYTPRMKWFAVMDSFFQEKKRKRARNSSKIIEEQLIDDNLETTEDQSLSLLEDSGEDDITIDEDSWIPKQPKLERSPTESINIIKTPTKCDNSLSTPVNFNNSKQLEIFGRSVTAQLKMLPLEQAILACDEIQSVLTKYRLKNVRQKRFK